MCHSAMAVKLSAVLLLIRLEGTKERKEEAWYKVKQEGERGCTKQGNSLLAFGVGEDGGKS